MPFPLPLTSNVLPVLPVLHRRLSTKVRDYYAYTLGRIVHQDEADIIAGLSMSLRMQVKGGGGGRVVSDGRMAVRKGRLHLTLATSPRNSSLVPPPPPPPLMVQVVMHLYRPLLPPPSWCRWSCTCTARP